MKLVGCCGGLLSVVFVWLIVTPQAFQPNSIFLKCHSQPTCPSKGRRVFTLSSFGSMFGGLFGGPDPSRAGAFLSSDTNRKGFQSKGPTNDIVSVVDGIKRRRLGGSDIIVSEIGLGTQRWCVKLASHQNLQYLRKGYVLYLTHCIGYPLTLMHRTKKLASSLWMRLS